MVDGSTKRSPLMQECTNSFLFLSLLLSFDNYQRTKNPNGSSLSPTLSEAVVENLNFETQEILYSCSKVSSHFDMSLYFL